MPVVVPSFSTSPSSSSHPSTSMTPSRQEIDHPTSSSSSSTSPTTTVSSDSETRAREDLSGIDSHPASVSSSHVERKERGDPLTKPTKNPKSKMQHGELTSYRSWFLVYLQLLQARLLQHPRLLQVRKLIIQITIQQSSQVKVWTDKPGVNPYTSETPEELLHEPTEIPKPNKNVEHEKVREPVFRHTRMVARIQRESCA